MNYDIQLAALQEFESFLNIFREEIGEKVIAYGNKFGALRESVSAYIAETYATDHCNPNMDYLHNFQEKIIQQDLPYIKKQIAITIEAIDIARTRMG